MAELRILSLLLLTGFGVAHAQRGEFRLSAAADSAGLGEAVTLTLESDEPLTGGTSWTWPGWTAGDTLAQSWEILSVAPVDSMASPELAAGLRRTQQIEVLAWDTGFKVIEPLVLRASNGDSALTNPVLIEVGLVPLEANPAPRPLQGFKAFQWSWYEQVARRWPWWVAALIAAAAIWFWRTRKPLEPATTPAESEAPAEPGHIIALRMLQALFREQPWVQGEGKATQSRLSDAIRLHLDSAFGVKSIERTTTELVQQLRNSSIRGLNEGDTAWLADLLQRSDLVKFAKQTLPVDAHERAVRDALQWVERTQPAPEGGAESNTEAPDGHG